MIQVSRPADRGFVLRYGAVAGGCALLHNAIVIGATLAGAAVLVAAMLSFFVLAVVGYLALCRIAFRTVPDWGGFGRYVVAMAANFPVNTALLWVFAVPLRLPVAIVAPAVTVLMAAINFAASRWAVGRGGAASCAS